MFKKLYAKVIRWYFVRLADFTTTAQLGILDGMLEKTTKFEHALDIANTIFLVKIERQLLLKEMQEAKFGHFRMRMRNIDRILSILENDLR